MAPTKRQTAKAATRAKVLSSARELFTEVGYDHATIRDIAWLSGMSTGAIFANFAGKAELYREVFGHDPISPEVGRELLEALQYLEEVARPLVTKPGSYGEAVVNAAREAIARAATDSAEPRQDKAA